MKTLITGGAGFVGFHLATLLVGKGHDVVIADNLFRGKKDEDLDTLLSKENVSLLETDLTERSAWSKLGGGYEQVYHLASINGTKLFYDMPEEVLRVGLLSALHALDWFEKENGVKDAKILYTSSNEAYAGALEAFHELPLPTPEDVPLVIADPYNARWSYAGQKLIGELLFINFSRRKNFRMAIVRPHNFYGPRAGWGHVIPQTLSKITAKTDPFPILGAEETRSFCYIQDAVEAMDAVMESEKTDGGTYHIGTSVETKIGDLIEELFKIADWHPKKMEHQPSPLGSVARRVPDVSKIKRDTQWLAKVPLSEGLERTVDWHMKNPEPQTS